MEIYIQRLLPLLVLLAGCTAGDPPAADLGANLAATDLVARDGPRPIRLPEDDSRDRLTDLELVLLACSTAYLASHGSLHRESGGYHGHLAHDLVAQTAGAGGKCDPASAPHPLHPQRVEQRPALPRAKVDAGHGLPGLLQPQGTPDPGLHRDVQRTPGLVGQDQRQLRPIINGRSA